jgi:hypothetical protein
MDIVEFDLIIMGIKGRKTRDLENYGKGKRAPVVREGKARLKRIRLLKQRQKLQLTLLIIFLFICSNIKIKIN